MLHSLAVSLREKRNRIEDNDNGFTLIELLVVVVIIGVLIAIAIPLYLNYTKGANDKGAQSDVRNAISVFETCNSDNNGYPSSMPIGTATTNPCTQTINTSSGTTLTYRVASDYSAYNLFGVNSKGNVTGNSYYCYNSAKGGSVTKITQAAGTTTVPATYSATAC